jgi:hypothetical protein
MLKKIKRLIKMVMDGPYENLSKYILENGSKYVLNCPSLTEQDYIKYRWTDQVDPKPVITENNIVRLKFRCNQDYYVQIPFIYDPNIPKCESHRVSLILGQLGYAVIQEEIQKYKDLNIFYLTTLTGQQLSIIIEPKQPIDFITQEGFSQL